MAPNIVRAWST